LLYDATLPYLHNLPEAITYLTHKCVIALTNLTSESRTTSGPDSRKTVSAIPSRTRQRSRERETPNRRKKPIRPASTAGTLTLTLGLRGVAEGPPVCLESGNRSVTGLLHVTVSRIWPIARTFLLPCVLVFPLIASYAGAEVINLGFPGENTAELDARFDRVLALHPAWVVIFAGGNDALNPAKFLAPEVSRENLLHMISRSREAGARVVLVTIHEPDLARLLKRHAVAEYGNKSPAERVRELDAVITALAAQYKIPLADFRSKLLASGGPNLRLSADGVHLTRAGYALLAATVRAKFPHHVPSSKTIVCFGDSLTYGIGVRAPGNAPESNDTYPARLRALLAR